MKRINEYKKLFGVEKELELKTLKTTYRNLVKEWHPDKFQEGDEKREEAEEVSRKVIDINQSHLKVCTRRRPT